MKIFKTISIIILLLLFVSSCIEKTSTSKEYLNQNIVSQETYLKDVNTLKKVLVSYIDSTNAIRKPKPKSKILSIEIDTIFYGSEGKISFLYLTKNENPYVVNNKDSIQFVGGCFIALKNKKNNSIEIVDKLKYKVTTSEMPNKISRDLRMMYLREIGYIEGKYNINDNRFWDSDVWK
jgi:hypothetical protein